MEWRGVTISNVFIGNFFFVAGIEYVLRHPLRNIVYIGIFFTVEMAFTLVAASYFALADGNMNSGTALKKTAGAFAFVSGLLGYYTVGNLMCQEAMFFSFPMGDTSRFFNRKTERTTAT
ncbi:MAG: hypothetical protein Q9162_006803 [Coniocarpon cinnabarinum]